MNVCVGSKVRITGRCMDEMRPFGRTGLTGEIVKMDTENPPGFIVEFHKDGYRDLFYPEEVEEVGFERHSPRARSNDGFPVTALEAEKNWGKWR